jgi:hypothetical protein
MADAPDLPWWTYRADGGPTYLERHGHRPDEACPQACHGNPAKPGGNGGPTARVGPSIADCLEAAMRADPSLTIEEAIRTVSISQETIDRYAAAGEEDGDD